MLVKANPIRDKFRNLAYRIFCVLDNNGDCDFDRNGERVFVEKMVRRLLSLRDCPVTVFDVGANVGDYAAMLLDKGVGGDERFRLHLFEPTRCSFDRLSARFSGSPAVVINRVAASDEAGTATIYFEADGSTLASLHQRDLSAYDLKMEKVEQVETVRLDMYIEKAGIDHLHFMKIDIEGHELAAFRGMGVYLNADFVDFIQFEYGGANLDSGTSLMALYRLMEDAGFVMTKIMRGGLEPRQYRPWMDNFQYANYVAVSRRVFWTL